MSVHVQRSDSRTESFVVRIWYDTPGEDGELRGEVQHVRSGQRRRFRGMEDLTTILRAWTALGQSQQGTDSPLDSAPTLRG